MKDRVSPQEESVTARRAQVLDRMATSRSALRAESDAAMTVAVLSSRSKSAVTAPSTSSSPLNILLTSPNAQIVSALLVGSVILSPRRVIVVAAVPLLRAVIVRAIRDLAAR